jgi:hypothetical protein
LTGENLKCNGGLELRQVEDPMQAEMAFLNVNGFFEEYHQLWERGVFCIERIKVIEVGFNFGQVSFLPPAQKVLGIGWHNKAVIGTDQLRFIRIARADRAVEVTIDPFPVPCIPNREPKSAVHVVEGWTPPAM